MIHRYKITFPSYFNIILCKITLISKSKFMSKRITMQYACLSVQILKNMIYQILQEF